MTVTVQLFAGAREAAGGETIVVDLPNGATYRGLAEAITVSCPALSTLVASARFAADAGYADPESPVDADAEIALIPPVSGG